MKIRILLLPFLLMYTGYAQELHLKAGLDIITDLDLDASIRGIDLNTNDNIDLYTIPAIHFEMLFSYPLNDRFSLGPGIRYESEPRFQTTFESAGFYLIPFFLSLEYRLAEFTTFDFLLSSRLGYNAIGTTRENFEDFNEHNGGFYYGFAVQLEESENSSLVWEVLYSVSSCSFEREAGLGEIEYFYTYSKISVTIGKRFGF